MTTFYTPLVDSSYRSIYMLGVLGVILRMKRKALLMHSGFHPPSVIWPVKDFSNLLQTVSLGLREHKPGRRQDEDQQNAEHDIIVPTDRVQDYRVNECKDDQ